MRELEMIKFADTLTQVKDNARVREIRDFEAKRVDRQFAPVKAKAAANAERMTKLSGWLTPW